MTIQEYLQNHWYPGQHVCEVNPATEGPARTVDAFHAVAVARVNVRLGRGAGKRREYGGDVRALCEGCIDLMARDARRLPL